jgi:hypothetical protein
LRTKKAADKLSDDDKKKGYAALFWSADATKSYGSWRECYDKVLKAQTATTTDPKLQKVKDFIDKGGLDFFAATEARLTCAGVCEPALFYATLDISLGRPEKDCVNALFDELQGGSKPGGIIALITGIVLVLGAIVSFPLCTGFSQNKE